MIRYLLFFFLPLPFFAVCLVMIALNGIFGKIEPETIERSVFIRLMQLRDFHTCSPEMLERLTRRAEQEFGRHSPNKPTFGFFDWEKKIHVQAQKNRTERPAIMENNLMLMARTRFFQWMDDYHKASREQKALLLSEVVADMNHWQSVYFDYYRALELPEPSMKELIDDFQRMVETFKIGAAPEEIERIDSFAQAMSRAMLAAEVQKVPQTLRDIFSPRR